MSIRLEALPRGKRIQHMLEAFRDVREWSTPVGQPCRVCPSCGKAFTAARKPRLTICLYPSLTPVPVAFLYRLCGPCAHTYRKGGRHKQGVIDAIERFLNDDEGENHA